MFTQRLMLFGFIVLAGATVLPAERGLSVSNVAFTPEIPVAARMRAVEEPSDAPTKAVRKSFTPRPRPLTYYTETVNRDLFGRPASEPEPEPETAVETPVSTPVSAPVKDPLDDYTFTGVVTVEERTMALIENKQTREGVYVEVGDRFLNGTIAAINEGAVSLDTKQGRRLLARNEKYSFTPLNANAPFLNAAPKPNTGSPTQPNPASTTQPAPMGTQAAANPTTVITTTGTVQTPEQPTGVPVQATEKTSPTEAQNTTPPPPAPAEKAVVK